MNIEFVVALAVAMISGLVGTIYQWMRSHQRAIEERLVTRITSLEDKTERALADLNQNLRHRVETLNTTLVQALQDDRHRDVQEMIKGYKTLYNLLERRGLTSIVRHDQRMRDEEAGFGSDDA